MTEESIRWLAARGRVLGPLLLVALVAVVYAQVADFEFVSYDDETYIVGNERIQSGLTGSGVAWAFTSLSAPSWMPMVWLSFMLGVEVHGMSPGAHHVTNVVLHCANVLLCYATLRALTGHTGRSLFVAAVFAVHPLHAEAVAWVYARKDVLSTLFLLLTLRSYLWHAEKPCRGRLLVVHSFLVLALASKPTTAVLPALLLLVDFWPLRRFRRCSAAGLVMEKVPAALLGAGAIALSFYAHVEADALTPTALDHRLANAMLNYFRYLGKAFWPAELAVPYPIPDHPGLLAAALALAGLVVLTLLCHRLRSRAPFLWFGWLWFVISLTPAVGIVQIGLQSMADRWAYVPAIGVYVAVSWGAFLSTQRLRWGARALLTLAVAIVVVLTALGHSQARHWRDSLTLFSHAVSTVGGTSASYYSLALAHARLGDHASARPYYELALEQDARHVMALNNLATTLYRLGDLDGAIARLQEALRVDPSSSIARRNLEQLLALKR